MQSRCDYEPVSSRTSLGCEQSGNVEEFIPAVGVCTARTRSWLRCDKCDAYRTIDELKVSVKDARTEVWVKPSQCIFRISFAERPESTEGGKWRARLQDHGGAWNRDGLYRISSGLHVFAKYLFQCMLLPQPLIHGVECVEESLKLDLVVVARLACSELFEFDVKLRIFREVSRVDFGSFLFIEVRRTLDEALHRTKKASKLHQNIKFRLQSIHRLFLPIDERRP